MSKYRVRISDLLENQITGEWGNAPSSNNAIPVIRTTNFCDDGQINFGDIAYRDIPLDKANKKYIKPGDIIIEKSGGTDKKPVGRVVYCENCFEGKKVLCNNFTQILRVNSSVSNPRYVFYLMYFRYNIGIPEHFQNKTTGIRNLQIKAYLDDYVSITDYDEQSRVVSILDHLLALINTRKQQLSKFDELAKSRFIEMFGDPISNSKGWEITKLEDLGELSRGISKSRPRNLPELLGGKYPLVQTGDVANSELYITRYNSTYSELGLKQSKMWKAGTLCITIAANIAKTAILKFDACFPDSIVGFKSNGKTNQIFIHYIFSFFQELLESQAPTVAQKNINLQTLQNLMVICPPSKFQNDFESFIQQLDKSKFRIKKSLEKLEMTYKALLQEYFG